jgi:hypothetical protein
MLSETENACFAGTAICAEVQMGKINEFGVADKLNSAPKYIVSSTLEKAERRLLNAIPE